MSVPEGVANDSNIQDTSDEEVGRLIESTGDPLPIAAGEWKGQQTDDMVENELSATGRPRRNVGNYRQGPAKIDACRLTRSSTIFLFWFSMILSDPCQCPQIVPRFKPTTILSNKLTSLSLQSVTFYRIYGSTTQLVCTIFLQTL